MTELVGTPSRQAADRGTGRSSGAGPDRRRPALLRWALPAVVTVVWAVVVLAADLGDRVVTNWESTLTMLVGSFLAGSSPEGGGAVAFPVFTKALEVPGPIARTFGLSIQAVGMTMAAVSIIAAGRSYHRRAVVVASAAGIVAFGLSAALLGRSGEVFWPPIIPSPWVKATFSIVLATTSVLMIRHLRDHRRAGAGDAHAVHAEPAWNRRLDAALILVAAAGGFLANLTGTGVNIVVFLFLVVVVGVDPKRALPSAVMAMAAVSVAGIALFGVLDGQLDVAVVDDRVVAVGSEPVDLDADRADLLGLWLAAVPVVVWGAPLGSLAASLVREQVLVGFVAVLAAVEVVTTVLLVPELRTDPALMAYLGAGLILLPLVIVAVEANRSRLFGVRAVRGHGGR